jgi:NADPH:quinone reductase-like Zn-dependent oxidoreductase
MYAAVVTSFDDPPVCRDFPVPSPRSNHETLVDVLAVGLHPRVRSQANGSHYTSTDELPLVPGIDGVGRSADGTLLYFILPDTAMGSMAEQTVIDLRRSVVLPAACDPLAVAAAMNPAMSSWVGLRRRIGDVPRDRVLVLGATGSAGRLAIQVAKTLGAQWVVAAGRDERRLAMLPALGADVTVSLMGDDDQVGDELAAAAADVDLVIDYLWGEPTALAMRALVTARPDRGAPLTWLQIGSVAGATSPIPSAALRAARLQIVGSGQGSVPTSDILAELPSLASAITAGTFRIDARAVPLRDVANAWADTDSDGRIVITP